MFNDVGKHTNEFSWDIRKEYMDPLPFIWKQFSNKSYVTSYLEDSTYSTFIYEKKGFLEQVGQLLIVYYGYTLSSPVHTSLFFNYRWNYRYRIIFSLCQNPKLYNVFINIWHEGLVGWITIIMKTRYMYVYLSLYWKVVGINSEKNFQYDEN